jgi:hypothetical protein
MHFTITREGNFVPAGRSATARVRLFYNSGAIR